MGDPEIDAARDQHLQQKAAAQSGGHGDSRGEIIVCLHDLFVHIGHVIYSNDSSEDGIDLNTKELGPGNDA